MKKIKFFGLVFLGIVSFGFTKNASAADMFRLYNPYSSEHFFTSSEAESDSLTNLGWKYEDIAWVAPETGDDVYRLYNPNVGDHMYTTSFDEVKFLLTAGWKYEDIAWHSAKENSLPLYRLYNPNATTGSHHYTLDTSEKDNLIKAGWKDEGVSWYAENKATYPFAIKSEDLQGSKEFRNNGYNIPNDILLNFDNLPNDKNGEITFAIDGLQIRSSFTTTLQQIPTKEIRVASAKDNTTRTISTNTRIKVERQINGEIRPSYYTSLYLTYNEQNQLILIAPNYAGNVLPEDYDIMLEYLLK